MKILLDEISFDGCRIVLDESPLVYSLNSGRCGLGGIKLLLQRGASVHDRDRFGNTCLHRYLERPGNGICDADASTVKDAFTYLIQQGADVLAQNHNGVSVSDVAYTTECTDTTLLTKFREELWDCVLANCGYDLAEFRRCRGRRFYNHPLEFMKGCVVNVWAGCDHLRPDYDNKTSPIYFSDCDDACDDRALRFLEGRNCGCMDSHDVSDEGDSAMEEVDQSDWSDREEVGDEGDSAMEDADDSDWSDSEDGGVTCV